MAYDYSDLVEKTKQWAITANSLGWLNHDATAELIELDSRTPETLFSANNPENTRPLIVAFMGGTGVGKSSLLNRLAGKAIAKSGVERPTSHEVTLFHHNNFAIQHLSEKLPLSKIKIAQHNDEAKKNIIWIDMPDFDSTEHRNKQLVLDWLPHIDILIYVVSPERYRDEKAWRLLLSEGGRHAWVFVINHWDRGEDLQFDDFRRQLLKAGFVDPVIFKTSCVEKIREDDFAGLESSINSLATSHIITQLEQRGTLVRKNELKLKLQQVRTLLGSAIIINKLKEDWQLQWQKTTTLLHQGFAWPISQIATHYAEQAINLNMNAASEKYPTGKTSIQLWDEWAKTRFDDALNEIVLKADQLNLPVAPLKNHTLPLRENAKKIVQNQSELAARLALANPGNNFHKIFLKIMRLCEITLPLVAMTWVSYRAFISYYTSNMNSAHYLGVDFVVHSCLLIALTWLIPYFILKKAQPSLKSSVLKGLTKGLSGAFNQIDSEVSEAVQAVYEEHALLLNQLDELIAECDACKLQTLDKNSPLKRMLI